MSFAFVFDREDDRYEFSYCYPYTISDLDEHLSSIESRRSAQARSKLACLGFG